MSVWGPLLSKPQFIILKGSKLKVSTNRHNLIPIYSFKTYLFTSRKKKDVVRTTHLFTYLRTGSCCVPLTGLEFTIYNYYIELGWP